MLSRAGADGGPVLLARLLPPRDGKAGALRSGEGTAVFPTVCPPGPSPQRWLVVGKPDERKPLHIHPKTI